MQWIEFHCCAVHETKLHHSIIVTQYHQKSKYNYIELYSNCNSIAPPLLSLKHYYPPQDASMRRFPAWP